MDFILYIVTWGGGLLILGMFLILVVKHGVLEALRQHQWEQMDPKTRPNRPSAFQAAGKFVSSLTPSKPTASQPPLTQPKANPPNKTQPPQAYPGVVSLTMPDQPQK